MKYLKCGKSNLNYKEVVSLASKNGIFKNITMV